MNIFFIPTMLFVALLIVGINKFFEKIDPNATKLSYKWTYIILTVIYSFGSAYYVTTSNISLVNILALAYLIILGTAAYMDLQTSSIYIVLHITLIGLSVMMFIIKSCQENIFMNTLVLANPFTVEIMNMFGVTDVTVLLAVLILCAFLLSIGMAGVISLGDAFIFVSAAIMYLAISKQPDVALLKSVVYSYIIFIIPYCFIVLHDKIIKKEKIMFKKYPFTTPMAAGILLGLFM